MTVGSAAAAWSLAAVPTSCSEPGLTDQQVVRHRVRVRRARSAPACPPRPRTTSGRTSSARERPGSRTTWTPRARRSRRTVRPASSGSASASFSASCSASMRGRVGAAIRRRLPHRHDGALASGSIVAGGPGVARDQLQRLGSRRRAISGSALSRISRASRSKVAASRPRPCQRGERGRAHGGSWRLGQQRGDGLEQPGAQLGGLARDAARCAAARRGGRRASPRPARPRRDRRRRSSCRRTRRAAPAASSRASTAFAKSGALLPQRVGRLRQQHAQQPVRRSRRRPAGDLGKRVEQHRGRRGLVHLRRAPPAPRRSTRGRAPCGSGARCRPAGTSGRRLAFDPHQLVVGQAAELILDGARRRVEEDLRRPSAAAPRRATATITPGRARARSYAVMCRDPGDHLHERLQRLHRLVERVLEEASCGWLSDSSATSAASGVGKKLAARTASSRTRGCASSACTFSSASAFGDAVAPVAQHARRRGAGPRIAASAASASAASR